MTDISLSLNSLVLYKNRPARVARLGLKKITIELEGRQTIDVRPKDILLLHTGPLENLSDLQPQDGELLTAWELLLGETTNIGELAELIFGKYTPSTAWATWQLVMDGLYFKGEPQAIEVRTQNEVETEKRSRDRKSAEEQAWRAFLGRVGDGEYIKEDEVYFEDVIRLANGEQEGSRVLKALKLAETPEHAHDFLLKIGFWDQEVNPYPIRCQLLLESAQVDIETPIDDARRDLTHLVSYAIDDEGSSDPDDALSIENGRLWVHVADAAFLVRPNSQADREAMERGANLYLPEGTITMLPSQVVNTLGLGLSEQSQALSFGLDLSDVGEIIALEIVPSRVKVTRLSYEDAESRLDEPVISKLNAIALQFRERRLENGAIEINLPEVRIQVLGGRVEIKPLPPLRSRELVREAMLIVGEAIARHATEHNIPMPYTTQERPRQLPEWVNTPSQMIALRNSLRPGRKSSHPSPHSGLGMDMYVQATSPLRRYLDLVVHQQLRAHLYGKPLLGAEEITQRIGSIDEVVGSIRRAERYSRRHWTLVYLTQNPDWEGKGIIVNKRGARYTCLLPDLALDFGIYPNRELELDEEVKLRISDINLAYQEADFRIVD
jgi:exoribonuclease-2